VADQPSEKDRAPGADARPNSPLSSINQLFRQSSVYMLGRFVSIVLGLVSFPLYTRVFTVADYGVLTLASRLVLFPVALAKFGLQTALMRWYGECADQGARNTLFSTMLFGTAAGSVLVTIAWLGGLFVGASGRIERPLFWALVACSGLIFARSVASTLFGHLRLANRALAVSAVEAGTRAASLAVAIVLLYTVYKSPTVVLAGVGAAEIAVLAITWYTAIDRSQFSAGLIDRKLLRTAVVFGAPLAGSEFVAILLNTADTVLVQHFLGAEKLGYYSAAVGLAIQVEDTVRLPLSLALVPLYMKMWTDEGAEATARFLSRGLGYYTTVAIGLTAAVLACARELVIVLSSSKYEPMYPLVAPLLAGYFIYAATIFVNAGLLVHKRTGIAAGCVVIAALFKIVLNVALIPGLGLNGAVATSIASHLLLLLLTHWVSSLRLTIHWPGVIRALLAAASGVAAASVITLPGIVAALLAKAVVFGAVYLAVILVFDLELRETTLRLMGREGR
jgi:O-antigen/teichoic acid export membrane protein